MAGLLKCNDAAAAAALRERWAVLRCLRAAARPLQCTYVDTGPQPEGAHPLGVQVPERRGETARGTGLPGGERYNHASGPPASPHSHLQRRARELPLRPGLPRDADPLRPEQQQTPRLAPPAPLPEQSARPHRGPPSARPCARAPLRLRRRVCGSPSRHYGFRFHLWLRPTRTQPASVECELQRGIPSPSTSLTPTPNLTHCLLSPTPRPGSAVRARPAALLRPSHAALGSSNHNSHAPTPTISTQ